MAAYAAPVLFGIDRYWNSMRTLFFYGLAPQEFKLNRPHIRPLVRYFGCS